MPTLKIKTDPVFLPAEGTLTVAKTDGDTIYYGSAGTYSSQRPVSSSDNTGTLSTSTTSTVGLWLISAGQTVVSWDNDATDAVVQTAEIEDLAVTTAKLGADAVTGAKIADLAVDTEHLAADSVTAAKIEAGAVDSSEIATDAVGTAEIAAGAVTSSELADNLTHYVSLSAPDLADDNYFLISVDMQATAYTLDQTTLPADNPPRNVTITHTSGDTADTLGDAVVVGTNVDDDAINETITISADGVATGTKAFKTITSVTTAGWVIDGVEATADNIEVGFGNKLGLDRALAASTDVALTTLGTAIVTPTVAVDSDEVEKNTVDISSGTYDGTKVAKALITP